MNEPSIPVGRKVVVVGAGAVGSTFCYALAQSGLADEIVLIDKNADLARGQALDLVHGQPFFPTVAIRIGDAADYADAHVIVVTAGTAQRPGETRLDLLHRNASIVGQIADDIAARGSRAIVIVVTNPVDVLTHVALRRTGFERGRVIGSGTVLDSARFRHLLSRHCGVDVHNVHAYVLGEHGDSELAAWSMTHVGGMPIDEYCPVCGRCEDWPAERARIEEEIRRSAYHIIDYKGATYFGIGLALVRIVAAVLRNERGVLTVSALLDGEFGLRDVCLSVPCIVSSAGVEKILEPRLPPDELNALAASAVLLKDAIHQLADSA
ncbi:MAG TPA: L-lactate dehydrogenase [Thermoguttaceae bacterium]|nr:L-lactate dehydrogenase [Thermoguttaceae bacterium]